MLKTLALLILSLGLATLCAAETFTNPYRVPLPSTPGVVLHGDVNGDGVEDLIYSDETGPVVLHTLFGSSSGAYTSGPALTLPAHVTSGCILADLNGDHVLDLACPYSNQFQASMVLFAGHGDGTFTAPVYFPLPTSNTNYFYLSLTSIGDINSDGVPDLVGYDGLNERSYIILSDGHGGFHVGSTPNTLPMGTYLDINGDGKVDAVSSGSTALGNGDGTFQAGIANGIAYGDTCVFGDVDRDGRLDAVCGYVENVMGDITGAWDLIVYHGNGDGTFNPNSIYKRVFGDRSNQYEDFGTFGTPLLVADVNGDGYPDIISNALDGTTVFYGGPNTTFSGPRHFATGPVYGNTGFVKDLNGDGIPDFVAGGDKGIYFSYGQKSGALRTAEAYEVTGLLGYAVTADFNGDGIPDVAASGDYAMTLSLGNGDGTFKPYTKINPGAPPYANGTYDHSTYAALVTGDFNGDGKPDLILYGGADINSFDLADFYFAGNGDGTFQAPVRVSTYLFGQFFGGILVKDLNGDGKDDTVVAPDQNTGIMTVNLSNGDGTFSAKSVSVPREAGPYGSFLSATTPAAADFDQDGKLDLVVASAANAYILHGAGDGTFTAVSRLAIPPLAAYPGGNAIAVATGDFDGDGHQDIAVLWGQFLYGLYGSALTQTVIFYGNGDGTFSAPVVANSGANGYAAIKSADLNQDGRAEIVLHGEGSLNGGTNVGVLHGLANRTFLPEVNYIAGIGLTTMDITDLNHDGFPDLVFANSDYNGPGNSVTVLLNLGNTPVVTGAVRATPEPSAAGQPFTLTAGLLAPDGSTLTGPVTFLLDGAPAGTAALAGNSASVTVTNPPAVGPHTLQATWPGNATFGAVTLTGTHVVVGVPTALTLTVAPSSSQAGSPVTFSYTLSSPNGQLPASGSLILTDGGQSLTTQSLASVSLPFSGQFTTSTLSTGTHVIQLAYSGDANYGPAAATTTEVVTGLTTALAFTSSPNPALVGQSVTLTATPSASCASCAFTAAVLFSDGGTPLGTAAVQPNGTATLVISFSTAADHLLTASYPGDAEHLPAAATLTQHILLADSNLALTSTPNSSLAGELVTFTATATASQTPYTGSSIAFLDSSALLATVPLDAQGRAVFQTRALLAGSHSITATLAQTASVHGSSAGLTQVVTRSPTTTSVATGSPSVYQNQSVTLVASVTSSTGIAPSGTVQFFSGTTLVGSASVNGTTASITYSPQTSGSASITAAYQGDSQTLPSVSAPATLSILPADFSVSTVSSLSLATGHHLTFNVQTTSIGMFTDTVSMTGTGLPAHMTLDFTPGQVGLGVHASAAVSVYLETDDVRGYKSSNSFPRLPGTLCLAGFLGLFFRRRRRVILLTLLAAALLLQLTGCSSKYPASVTPGDYTITLHATGLTTHITHQVDLPVHVTEE